MYCVYCHTNLQNGKRYIGITCQKPEERWKQGAGYIKHHLLYPDIKKYGWENFSHEIICDGLSRDDAEWLESFYMGYWNTTAWGDNGYDPNAKGYNIEDGNAPVNALWDGEEARERGDVLTPQAILKELHDSEERMERLLRNSKGSDSV